MRRVLVAGISGAGKTTLARQLAGRLGLPRHELDALHHGPGWVKRPSFEEDVTAFADDPAWVCEDQYQRLLGTLLWERADTVVWLDLPRRVVMRRVLWRTASRMVLRTELYNGNREQPRALLDPGHPVRWAWSQHAARRAHTAALAAAHPTVRVVRLHTPREVAAWLARLGAVSG
ncbi:MAG: adenylate kinase [Thermoleophilia bacterium]|nr:adenylate kinase [Thermoleophilia bacterium]